MKTRLPLFVCWLSVVLAGLALSPAAAQTNVAGNALQFNTANNRYVEIPRSIQDDFTIEFWVKTASAGGTGTNWFNGHGLVDAEVPGAANDFGLSLLNGKVAFGVGNPDITIISTGSVNDNQWHHVAATRTLATGLMILYIDGAEQSRSTVTTNRASLAAPTTMRIGGLQTGASLTGQIDEVRLWTSVRSLADIRANKNVLVANGTATLVANYRLSESSGNTAANSGTNGATGNGTLVNTPTWVTPSPLAPVYAEPIITSLAPANGSAGTSVVITGANFTNVSGVTFNGTAATFTVNSVTQITATVPAGATTGKVGVSIPVPAGTTGFVGTTTSTQDFIITAAPVAVADATTTSYRQTVTINLLTNDTPGGAGAPNTINPATVVLSGATGSNGGTFSVNTSGVVTFTPPATIVGNSITTSVTYTVKNTATVPQTSNVATITVTVTNATPAVNDGVNLALVNTDGRVALSPTLSGSDLENDAKYFTITGGLPTAMQGELFFNGTAISATPSVSIPVGQVNLLTFDPAANYVGRVVLTFNVTDGSNLSSLPATYTIPVGAANTISGVVYEDVNYGGGTGRSQAASSSVGRNGATVELYNSANVLQASVQTATVNNVAGVYTFTGRAAGTYTVRVVNNTVTSSRSGYVAGLLPVQTYVNGDGNRVGGENPRNADGAAGALAGAQSVATLTLAAGGTAGSDFGFNFDAVVNTNDTGQGSLRQFIVNANALANDNLDQRPFNDNGLAKGPDFPAGQETSIFMLTDGTARPGLRAGLLNQLTDATGTAATTNSRALITLASALSIVDAATAVSTALDGTTQSTLSNSNPVALGTGGTVGTGRLALSKVEGPEVEIIGATSLENLVRISSTASILRGVSLHGGNNTLLVDAGTNVLIEQNVVGVSAFTDVLPALVTNSTAVTLINPSGLVRNNIIAYAGVSGLNYSGTGAGYTITNNEFNQNGQRVAGGDNITIADQVATGKAGPVVITGNLIANSNSSGIQFDIAKLSTNTVQENTITGNGLGGTTTRLEGSGIHYLSRNGTERGNNPDLISRNIIINNQSSGVVVNYGQRGIQISQNSIYQNGNGTTGGKGLLAIDLTQPTYFVSSADATGKAQYGQGDGVSANDGVVSLDQANGGMDYPVITTIEKIGTNQLRVAGYIGSNPAGNALFGNATVEVYSANNADTNQNGPTTTTSNDNVAHGESQSYLGTLTADATGRFDFTFPTIAATINPGDIVTGIAYLAAYGTSEAGVNQTSSFKVLPVELKTFAVQAAKTDAVLDWATASEKNNSHFEVERSLNSTGFVKIGTVRGRGTTQASTTYSFVDVGIGAQTKLVYYRLRQVDTNGAASYSPVRTVRFEGKSAATAKLRVFPNPAGASDRTVTLDLTTLPQGTYQATLLDATGRVLGNYTAQGGLNQALEVQHLPTGTYIVLVRGNNQSYSVRLIKE